MKTALEVLRDAPKAKLVIRSTMPENPYQSPETEGQSDHSLNGIRRVANGAMYGVLVGGLGCTLVMAGIEAYNIYDSGFAGYEVDWSGLLFFQAIFAVANAVAG